MKDHPHTDIQMQGWIGRLPARARPFALLARLDRPIGVWLLLLPGLWAIALAAATQNGHMKFYDWFLMILFVLGAVVMRAAGCVINDLWDRKLDAKVERTQLRPLASGAVSLRDGALFLLGLLLIGLLILLQMNHATLILGLIAMPLIIAYPLMKRITWWPQAFLGLTFNFGALMGWSAVTGGLNWPCLVLYAGCILWTIGYDTIYAHQDKEDDALIGIKSTALKFGDKSHYWVTLFYAGFWCALALVTITSPLSWPAQAGALAAGLHLLWQVRRWDLNNPQNCLETFQSNRDLGLIILIGFLMGSF